MNLFGVSLLDRIKLMRWLIPLLLGITSVLYQLGPARYVHDRFGLTGHYAVEILFYGTFGPLLVYWALAQVGQWLKEKTALEKKAQAGERRLASITSASADAILGVDEEGMIESWNRGAELLFGYTAGEMIGQPIAILFEGDSASSVEARWLREMVETTGFVSGHETSCLNSLGETVSVELTATLLLDDEHRGMGMSVIIRDTTARKRREAAIRRLNESLNLQVAERTSELAAKIEELGKANSTLTKLDQMRTEFVSLVSHQLRAPLTNMSGAVQRMQLDCGSVNPTCQRMFSILDQQTRRLDNLVRDVLNAAQIESGALSVQAEPLTIMPLVKQVMEQIRARTNDRPFVLREKPGLPLAWADRAQVSEVIANLLDNADKYSPVGEPVVVEVGADQTSITISIRDRGAGIPTGMLGKVFDRYYRVDGSDSQAAYGYGLGLYVCKKLVEVQGGRIWAENHPRGAVFSFTLPVWQENYDS